MTENEKTISVLKHTKNIVNGHIEEALDIAIQALEELERYRAVGTVEEFDNAMCFELAKENKELSNAVDEYLQYVKLGTVEEFKALKEKSVAKKPKKSGVTDSNGVFHAINGINGVPYDLCPNCEINLCTDGMFGGNRDRMKYCKNCGQKLDFAEDWT